MRRPADTSLPPQVDLPDPGFSPGGAGLSSACPGATPGVTQNNKKRSAGDVAGLPDHAGLRPGHAGPGLVRNAQGEEPERFPRRRTPPRPRPLPGNHGRGGARRRVDHRYGQARLPVRPVRLVAGVHARPGDHRPQPGVLAADRAPAGVHRDPGAGAALPGLLAPDRRGGHGRLRPDGGGHRDHRHRLGHRGGIRHPADPAILCGGGSSSSIR